MTTTPDPPVDATVDDALNRVTALAVMATLDGLQRARVDDLITLAGAVRSLRVRNTRLGLLRHEAEAKVGGLLALVRPVQDAYARCAGYDHTTDERLREAGLDRLADALSALDALDAS